MNTNLTIRPIRIEDLPFVKGVLNNVIETKDSYLSECLKTDQNMLNWFEEHQNNDRYVIFIAELSNAYVGWVSLSNFRMIDGYNCSAELSVYIDVDYQNKGYASLLMDYIEKYAVSKGLISNMISVITSTNEASIALHRKMGYKVEGVLKRIAKKSGQYKDVILMVKNIAI